ncbi:hypothetical protein [Microbacterium sp. CFBP9034]|uniref:hypothetical protein n=1 Tax=Microbacterium sp. CFBP9034 TaxID=3096540 RepID=UPI002A6A46ED|nr:hypothetical protein [Microbacterium sp. CFBP9034]MDY0910731.1 hypothetical protein [Microbacterium sp. CFBP9034]
MTDDLGVEDTDDGEGHVIVSFTVISVAPIEGLAQYLSESRTPADEFFYDLGTTSFEEREAEARADRLEATINAFLDLLEPIPHEALHDPGAFVRLFMTLCRGAETIHAKTLKRLADANATIWIDA